MPKQADERINIARRLVSQRCLYGVDINPLAVELAKLSIWLVTLAEGRPFGFLDHNLRSGDSLLGIHRIEQLVQVRLTPAPGERQTGLLDDVVADAVQRANAIRVKLRSSRDTDITDVLASAALDRQARSIVRGVDRVADTFIGEVVRLGPQSKSLNGVCDSLALRAPDLLKLSESEQGALVQQTQRSLDSDLPDDAPSRQPFHWPLEFPEVFLQGGFDAIVGNPPFSGGRMIGRSLGEAYVRYLGFIRTQVKGSPDLCAYFILRAAGLIRSKGEVGLLATKSITETGSRVVCLDQLLNRGYQIRRAISRQPWPGKAKVVVSVIWIHRGSWGGEVHLANQRVAAINSALEEDFQIDRPQKLRELKGRFSQGQDLLGRGFELSSEERDDLLRDAPQASDVIVPLFNGQDINNMPRLSPYRWAIYFRDWPESRARQYSTIFERVERLVRPYRDSLTGQIHQKDFWKFWDLRPGLMREFADHPEVLASGSTAKYVIFRRVPTSNVYNHSTKLYFLYEWADFALLQSSLHQEWAYWNSGTMGASTLRYSTSTSLETWPMPDPESRVELNEIGKQYHQMRENEITSDGIGLTEFYNRVHDQALQGESQRSFRALLRRMDCAVLDSYGWSDIDLEHGFHELEYLPPRDCVRFTMSRGARIEVLRRLSRLNRERYHEEQAVAGSRSAKRGRRGRSETIPSLLDDERLTEG